MQFINFFKKITAHLSGLNTLSGDRIGKTLVRFKDDCEIQITNPAL